MNFETVIQVPKNKEKDKYLSILANFDVITPSLTFQMHDQANDTAWKCVLDKDTVVKNCEDFDMKVDDYWQQISDEIQNPSGTFVYCLENKKFSMKLIEEGTIITLFTLPAQEMPEGVVKQSLLAGTFRKAARLQQANELLEKTNKQLVTERNAFAEKLEKLTLDKTEWEEKLFDNFVELLNRKKKYNEVLKVELAEARAVLAGKRPRNLPQEDSAEEYEVETDEDSPPPSSSEQDMQQGRGGEGS